MLNKTQKSEVNQIILQIDCPEKKESVWKADDTGMF